MTVLTGRFNGQTIIFDGPVPSEIPADTPVRVLFETRNGPTALDKIAQLAGPSDLPADYSEQHEHYVKGTSRK